MLRRVFLIALTMLCLSAWAAPKEPAWSGEGALFVVESHRVRLNLDIPGTNDWFGRTTWVGKTAGLFFPGEPVDLDVEMVGVQPTDQVTLELTPIQLDFVAPEGSDTFYNDANYGVIPYGAPIRRQVTVPAQDDKGHVLLKLRNLQLQMNGLHAVVIEVKGRGRQGVGTVARGLPPAECNRWQSQAMYHLGVFANVTEQLDVCQRLGYKWIRTDAFPNWWGVDAGKDKPFDWTKTDAAIEEYRKRGLYIISNMYGSPPWSIDRKNWDAYFYCHNEEYDPIMGQFAEGAAKRYCGADGEGPLQIVDYWNEPWECGGISAWRGDSIRYRQLYGTLYDGLKRGSPKIKVGGCSSIMNTMDKFFQYDTGTDWSKKIDVLSDHYVPPHACYGPRVAERMGIFSIESETWLGNDAPRVVNTLALFLAAGQKIVNANHPAHVIWSNASGVLMLRPSGAAMNIFFHFTNGRPFERVVFFDNLPYLFQFGKGKNVSFVLTGDPTYVYDVPQLKYWQIKPNGSMRLSSLKGKLQVYDVYGNLLPTKKGYYTVPISRTPVWVTADGLDAEKVIDAVRQAQMEKVKPVELIPRDFTAVPGANSPLQVEVHNVLNRPVAGTVTVSGDKLTLATASLPVTLNAGERKTLAFPVATVAADAANAYPVTVQFAGKDGDASYSEVLNADVISAGSPTIDGQLADWDKALPVRVIGPIRGQEQINMLWRPWEQNKIVDKGMAEFRAMRDDKFLYIAVRERNKVWTPMARLSTRNDDIYFGTTPETKHTYWAANFGTDPGEGKNPYAPTPYVGNVLQIGIGLGLGSAAHNLPEPKNVPIDLMAMPDTDYEYGVWGTPDGGVEIWRSYYAGGPTSHYFPRTLPFDKYNGLPPNAKAVVRKDGDDVIYEVALPLADMKLLKPEMLAAGKTICLTFRLPGSGVLFGTGKAATRPNGMSLLPRWEQSPSNSIRWGLAEK